MTEPKSWLTTEDAAPEVGTSRTTMWRVCRDNPGFGVRAGGSYRIPAEHIARVKAGELPEAIATEARAKYGAGRAA